MRIRALTVVVFISASAALGQQHPNLERGFMPEKMYDFSAIDTVNTFNGDLMLHIPLVGARANGILPYQLTLVYNSLCWEYVTLPPTTGGSNAPSMPTDPNLLQSVPSNHSNAGMGWSLSLGHLLVPGDTMQNQEDAFSYVSADSAEHPLHQRLHDEAASPTYQYTRDSSYTRYSKSGHEATVELADGTIQTIDELTEQAGDWPPATTQTNRWRLTSIKDRLGNSVTIGYSTSQSGANPFYTEIWTITDGPRTTKVYFRRDSDLVGSSSFFDRTLDHIDTPAFGGETATYNFTYEAHTMSPGAGNSVAPDMLSIAMLTSITLPSNETYAMSYIDGVSDTPGVLSQLTLPTGGNVQWTYTQNDWGPGSWEKPTGDARPLPPFVASRTFGGGTWNYGRFPGQITCTRSCPPGVTGTDCPYGGNRQLTTWVTAPDSTSSLSYFSVYVNGSTGLVGSDICDGASLWDPNAYGLPFTPSDGTVSPSNGATNGDSAILTLSSDNFSRYLSNETRTGFTALIDDNTFNGFGRPRGNGTRLRSTWVTYDHDGRDSNAGAPRYNVNPRVTSSLTLFDDDVNCASATCYNGIRYFGFDNYGHFQQSSGLSNFPGSSTHPANFRTTFTNYDTSLDTNHDWVLGTFSEQCSADESSQRYSTTVTACSDLAVKAFSLSNIERSTGKFLGRRTKDLNFGDGSTNGNGYNDLLALFDYDESDHGFVSREKYYGGDVRPLTTTSGYTTGGTPDYEIDHSYTFTSGALTEVQSQYNGASFLTEDADLDSSTGLVSAARDSAGLQTSYSYDKSRRLITMTPPDTRPTSYSYTNASGANGPSVVALTTSATGGGSIQNEYRFDPWGRLGRVKTQMYNGSSSAVVTTFDALGRKTSVGMPEVLADDASPSHVTTFTYDAFGRTTKIKQPDQTDGTAGSPDITTRISYTGAHQVDRIVNIAQSTGDADATTTEVHDALGRLYSVTEQSGASGAPTTTTYDYDLGDRLIAVATGSQSRAFTYDGRGFLISETHPEKGASGNGTTLYQTTSGTSVTDGYDARGHARRRIDGTVDGPFDVKYTYDTAERLSKVEDPDPASNTSPKARRTLKQFTFATANAPSGCTDTSAGATPVTVNCSPACGTTTYPRPVT